MKLSSYFVLSTLVVIGNVSHAYVSHEQFYPAVVYLSTDKISLAIMYNFAFMLFLLFGKILLKVFIGTLRDLEVEQLIDSGRGFLADTILFLVFYAPTIDNKEVGTVYLIQFICCVIFMKVFHLITQIRVSHMFEVGVPRLIVNVKLLFLMFSLLSLDIISLQYFYNVASRSSTFFTWILFEALTMTAMVLVALCKYTIHMVDLRLDNGWPGKSVYLFYIELASDVVSMTIFLIFMLTFFVQNPSRLPIYMMADVIQVARKLTQRLKSFRRYRQIANNMEERFPDATEEEIDRNQDCVICREPLWEGSKAKKLPCSHVFHIDCLRSWLVMQQCCPMCRADIPIEFTPPVQPQQQMPEQPPQQAAAPAPAAAVQGQAPAAPAAYTPPPEPPARATEVAPAAENRAPGGFTAPAPAAAPQPAKATAAPAPSRPWQAPPPKATPSAASTSAAGSASAATYFTQGAAYTESASPTSDAYGGVSNLEQMLNARSVGAPQAPQVIVGVQAPQVIAGLPSLAGALPPVEDIVKALEHAQQMAAFMREQTDFWMEQVRQIEKAHSSESKKGSADDGEKKDGESQREDEAPQNPLAALRRDQQRQWEIRRSQSSLSAGGESSS